MLNEIAQTSEVDWKGLAPLNIRVPYCRYTSEVFDFAGGRTKLFCKRPPDGYVFVSFRALQVCALNISADWLHFMHKSCARIFDSGDTLGCTSVRRPVSRRSM